MPIEVDKMADGFRVDALQRTGLLDTPAEERFDRLTRLARRALGVEIALITLVDADRQWFKSKDGLSVCETDRSVAFCDHAIRRPHEIMIVPDAQMDDRFRDNPLVLGDPKIGFYAGAPLVTQDGYALGTLCVIDSKPRANFNAEDQQILRDLAQSVMIEIELSKREEQLSDLNVTVDELKHRMGNMYAHVSSIVSVLGRAEGDKEALLERLREQIASFGQSQALLSASGHESAPLEELLQTVLAPYRRLGDEDRISIEVDVDRAVSPRGVFLLTLILGELATNAVKHGALGARTGTGRRRPYPG